MITADDPLNWWADELAGLNPETTPGEPKAGWYLLRKRIVTPNDAPDRRPGDPRSKVRVVHLPIFIWHESGWQCVIHHEDGTRLQYSGADTVDEFFSRCCRAAITKSEYEERINDSYRIEN